MIKIPVVDVTDQHYRIRVRNPIAIKQGTFRTINLSIPSNKVIRGQAMSGKYVSQSYLIGKQNAKVYGQRLIATNESTRKTLDSIRSNYGPIKVMQ